MEQLTPRQDYRLKLDILTNSVKTQFDNFMEIAKKCNGANAATLQHAVKLHETLKVCLETIGDQVELYERENSETVDSRVEKVFPTTKLSSS